jgi:hypothetical protein
MTMHKGPVGTNRGGNQRRTAVQNIAAMIDKLPASTFDKLQRTLVSATPAKAKAAPAAKPAPVRTPSSGRPSPTVPGITPRPAVNPNAPMGREDARLNMIVRSALESAAMVLAHNLGRPQADMLTSLAVEIQAESAKGLDFLTALNRAKMSVAAAVRTGVV